MVEEKVAAEATLVGGVGGALEATDGIGVGGGGGASL